MRQSTTLAFHAYSTLKVTLKLQTHADAMMLSDVDVEKPDEKSIMTYLGQILKMDPEYSQSVDPKVCSLSHFLINTYQNESL